MDGRAASGLDVFRLAFEEAGEPRAVVDFGAREGGVGVAANRAWRELFRIRRDPDGLPAMRLMPDADLYALVERLARGGELAPVACHSDESGRVGEFGDGVVREVELQPLGGAHAVALREVRDERGTIREMQESAKWLRAVVDNTNHPMYVKDFEGRYLFANRSWIDHYRQLSDDPVGRTDAEIYPPDVSGPVRANDLLVWERGEACEFEERAPATNGYRIFVSLKFPLVDGDGRAFAIAGVSTDITRRKEAEAALIEAREATQRADDAKSEFLSRMSHELRTPLNSIMGYAQLLQRERLPDGAPETVTRIMGAGRHLQRLINEVLDLSRIESGQYHVELEPVHACEPLKEALELIRPLARQRGVEVASDLHAGLFAHVLADRQRLLQVLLNLLSNAVKYNRRHGQVKVSFERAGEEALRFLVADEGRGLEGVAIDRIFMPFDRLDADATATEGSGLGLAVSKGLVEAMGGTIGLATPPSAGGSVFFVELPLTSGAGPDETLFPAAAARTADARPPLRSTILYVEDNADNLDVVERLLASVGEIELLAAGDGRAGLELARSRRPDVILLDLNLPGLSGEQVLRELKGDEALARIPVIVLSADATPRQIARLTDAGASAYLTKPLDLAELLDVLHATFAAAP